MKRVCVRVPALSLLLALALTLLPTALAADQPWLNWKPEWGPGEERLYGYKSGEEWVIPPQYSYAEYFDELGYAVVTADGKVGVIDTAGAWVLEPAYDNISGVSPDGLRYFKQNGKYGVMDAAGRVVHPADIEADWMGQFVNGSCVYVVGEKYGLVGADGRRITEPVYDEIKSWFEPADGARPARKGELWGILAADGTERGPFRYTRLEIWSNGYGKGMIGSLADGKWYILKPDGSFLTDMAFDSVEWGDPDSEDSFEAYHALPDRELVQVSQNGLLGAVSLTTGELVCPCAFADAASLRTAIYLKVTAPEKLWETVDRLGREAGLEVTWYPQGEGISRLYGSDRMLRLKDGQCALSGLDGTLYTGYEFDTIREPGLDGLFPASKNGKWGKLDKDGNVAVEFLYDTEKTIGVNAKFVSKKGDGKPPYALADRNGSLITGYDFWAHTDFSYGFAMVTDGTAGWRFIDAAGKDITEQKYNGAGLNDPKMAGSDFGEDGFAVVQYQDHSGYNVINSQGEEILPQVSYHKPRRAGYGLWVYDPLLEGVGISDSEGNVIIEPQYIYTTDNKGFPTGYSFDRDGYMQVGEGLYYDTKGNLVERQALDPWLREGLIWTSISAQGNGGSWGGGWGFADADGKLVVPHLYVAVGHFDYGYASVMAGEIFGMLKNPLSDQGEQTPPAEEAALAGLDILWLDGAEGELNPLGSDQLVTDYVIRGYGRWQVPYGDHGLWSVEGEHLLTADQAGAAGCYPQGPSDARIYKMSEEKIDTGEPGGDTRYTDILGRTYLESELWDWDAPWNPPELDCSRAVNPETNRIEDGKYFYADPWTGEIVLPAIYDEALSFSDGIGLVTIGGDRFAIDRTGARLFDLNGYEVGYPWFQEGRLQVWDKQTGKQGFLDKTGEPVGEGLVWDYDGGNVWFHEGATAVSKNGRWGIIDLEGSELIPCVFDDISGFADGIATVTLDGRQGILRDPRYKDKVSGWAQTEVAAATSAGYVTESCREYQTFTTTRRQFAELVVNYLEKATGETISPAPADTFTDTADEAVLKAYAAGVVQGVGEGRFSPGGLLTREQLATMLWRAMSGAGMTAGVPADLTAYADGDQVSDWARESLSALVGLEVMAGTGGNELSPKASCTVEQAVLLVYRAAAGSVAAWGPDY